MKKRLTLKDIANIAGVSSTAVSMCLNNREKEFHISEATCEKIRAIVAEYNYQPNPAAQAVAKGKTNLIGCMLYDNIDKSFWADILSGINEVLAAQNLHLVMTFSMGDLASELKAFQFLRDKGVDGYLWMPLVKNGMTNAAKLMEYNQEKPIVVLSCEIPGFHSVSVNECSGGIMAARHLLDLGHRKVAAIGHAPGFYGRGKYFMDEFQKNNISCDSFADAADFFAKIKNYTAVFCFSDYQALKVYQYAQENQIKIPEDLAVVGYDNLNFTEFLAPALTTVNQPKCQLGIAGAKILLEAQKNNTAPIVKTLEPELIIRKSTGYPGQ